LDSSFLESPTDEHVRLRRILLESGRVLPSAVPEPLRVRASQFPDGLSADQWQVLRESGVLVFHLNEPLSDDRFLALGETLGTAMPETAAAVTPYVERGVILNIINEHTETPNTDIQPFATSALTLHTEGSGRRFEDQPRYLILMCLRPGGAAGAQTVLIPMTAVERRMRREGLVALSRTRYRNSAVGTWIVRDMSTRCVFSFRDFHSQTLTWTHEGPIVDPDVVNAYIRELLASMYSTDQAVGIHWSVGLLIILDNTFFFHGRTAALTTATRSRHLKRLRILAKRFDDFPVV
jgi:alpha-ketoglutarate-dependent taurine dioxygenase